MAATSSHSSPGHATVITLTIELIGVGLMAVIADTGQKMGKIIVALMAGFMLMWFMINAQYFASIIGKAGKYA